MQPEALTLPLETSPHYQKTHHFYIEYVFLSDYHQWPTASRTHFSLVISFGIVLCRDTDWGRCVKQIKNKNKNKTVKKNRMQSFANVFAGNAFTKCLHAWCGVIFEQSTTFPVFCCPRHMGLGMVCGPPSLSSMKRVQTEKGPALP